MIAAELGAWDQRREDARRLAGATRMLAIGSGVDEITASELALKIEEGTHVPTTPLGMEKSLHGHLPAADASTGVVLLRFDPSNAAERDERAQNVVAATSVLGMPLVELRPQDAPSNTAEALLAGAIALQLLTLELTPRARHEPGPDPPRGRHVPPRRRRGGRRLEALGREPRRAPGAPATRRRSRRRAAPSAARA